jgi:hypothetical protein
MITMTLTPIKGLKTVNADSKTKKSPDGRSGHAVYELLQQVARLCALGHVREEVAVEMLRDGFKQATEALDTGESAGIDAFVAGQVLGEWHQNARFLDTDGRPAPLSVSAGRFAELCRTASIEVDDSSVLSLLTQADAVSVQGDLLIANRRDLILDHNHPAALARAVHLTTGFVSTLNHNLTRSIRDPRRFERTVLNVKLSQRHLPALLGYMSVHGQSFLEDLDSWMSARESTDPGPTVGVGLYLFVREHKN